MTWGAAGAVLAVLLAVFIAGRAWFALVEGGLGLLRRLLGGKKRGRWHALPPDWDKKENEHD